MRLRTRARLLILLGVSVAVLTCLPIGPSNFEPSGTQWYLKATVRMVKLTGAKTGNNPTGLFGLDFTGQSLTADTASDTMPAGLVLRSLTSPVQHMIIAKGQRIVVPAGHDTLITIGTFCCNESRNVPSFTDSFAIGPITDNTELQEIVSITRFKRLNSSNVLTVQNAVWSVTDGNGLTQVMIDSLNLLPNDSTVYSPEIVPVQPGFYQLQKERARANFRR
jgi:hypothetical protein